jgi:hypothetical protein
MQGKIKPQSRLAARENTSMPSFELTVYIVGSSAETGPRQPAAAWQKADPTDAHSIEAFGQRASAGRCRAQGDRRARATACGELAYRGADPVPRSPDPGPGPRS